MTCLVTLQEVTKTDIPNSTNSE